MEMGTRELGLEEIIEAIGDEAGKKYRWFITGIEAYGNVELQEIIDIDDIRNACFYGCGYYEIEWDFLKKIAPKVRCLVDLFLSGCRDKEEFIKKANEIRRSNGDWTKYSFDLDFEICDSQIWEISGKDIILVERLNKTFAPFSNGRLL